MAKFFKDVYESSCNANLPVIEGQQYSAEILKANVKILEKLMNTDGSSARMPRINMTEALGAADASILFKKVIDTQLVRPIEPEPVFSTRLAKTVTVGNARSVVFPTIGAIRAAEISDIGDWPEAHPGFTQMTQEILVRKFGIQVPISEDVIADSQWDVVALFLEGTRYAMSRLKEESCANEFSEHSTVVFDNALGTLAGETTGIAPDGTRNGTLSFKDVVDAIGVLVTNQYNPTDITVHPMMWTVFAKDPILQFLMLQNGQAAQTVASLGPDAMKSNIPWAFNVNVSPFVNYNVNGSIPNFITVGKTTAALTGPMSDLYISDRNNSLVILEREPLSIEEFNDPYRDIHRIKCKERYGVGTLNNGNAVASIKNILIGENSQPAFSVRTISA